MDMNDVRYYMGEFYKPAYIVFEGDEVYRLSQDDATPAEKWIAVENSGINNVGHFYIDGNTVSRAFLDLDEVYRKIELYDGKPTPSQKQTIEWLVNKAQSCFLESEVNRRSRIFNWRLTDSHKSVCLEISTNARPNTGALCLVDSCHMIWIGKRGGIQRAKNTRNRYVSDYMAMKSAKRGTFIF